VFYSVEPDGAGEHFQVMSSLSGVASAANAPTQLADTPWTQASSAAVARSWPR
jgi:hypothetical protein